MKNSRFTVICLNQIDTPPAAFLAELQNFSNCLKVFFTVITALDSKISDINYMFKVFFQTCWIGGTIYHICRILGKCNKVIISKCNIRGLFIHIHFAKQVFLHICQQGRYCLSVVVYTCQQQQRQT